MNIRDKLAEAIAEEVFGPMQLDWTKVTDAVLALIEQELLSEEMVALANNALDILIHPGEKRVSDLSKAVLTAAVQRLTGRGE